jgi:hypothetical protein
MADAMDSKSISRKGVGVQVPASAPGRTGPASQAVSDPLARAMLPVVLHRVANATQRLNGVSALLAIDPGTLATRSEDLAETSGVVDDSGWLLALIASVHGARLLLARRERQGLRPLVACVRDCLRLEGRDLAEPGSPLPDLAPDVGDGWQLPWSIGTWLYLCGRALEPRRELAWSFKLTSGGSAFECAAGNADFPSFKKRLARELPEAVLTSGKAGTTLCFPAGWLGAPESSA